MALHARSSVGAGFHRRTLNISGGISGKNISVLSSADTHWSKVSFHDKLGRNCPQTYEGPVVGSLRDVQYPSLRQPQGMLEASSAAGPACNAVSGGENVHAARNACAVPEILMPPGDPFKPINFTEAVIHRFGNKKAIAPSPIRQDFPELHGELPGRPIIKTSATDMFPETGAKQRKRRFPEKTIAKLRAWFVAHLRYPYPNEDEKQDLVRQTGLQMDQISNWFINARRHMPLLTMVGTGSGAKQRKRRFPEQVTAKLQAWLVAHLRYPYPNEDEKQDLMRQTGLQMDQISNWFIDARRHIPLLTMVEKGTSARQRKRWYPEEATAKLQAWFVAHLRYPYPNEDEKQDLMRQTGLQMDQVSYWFINARRRQLRDMINNARAETDAIGNKGMAEAMD